jgi:hypothetical protein
MNYQDKVKRMIAELLDLETDTMKVFIGYEQDNLEVEFYSPETTIGVARTLEWDSFYSTIETMIEELNESIRIHRKRMQNIQERNK